MQSEFFFFMQFLVTGLSMGSIYALVALGFVLIYKSTSILNLAQGEFMMAKIQQGRSDHKDNE